MTYAFSYVLYCNNAFRQLKESGLRLEIFRSVHFNRMPVFNNNIILLDQVT